MAQHNITAFVYDKRGQLLTVGRNSYTKTHPLQAKMSALEGQHHKIFLHAEVDSLVKLKDWGRAHRMVITRFTKDGEPAMAKPCGACQRVIKLAGIKHIEHT